MALAAACRRALPARRGAGALRCALAARRGARATAALPPPPPAQPGRVARSARAAQPRALATDAATSASSAPSGGARKGPTFQQAIARLQEFWASVGCATYLPHNTEVGAGTMNPATFLRVLGPEPWNVAYAEPSIRPDDSRYGDNPNRVQRHTQFQARGACCGAAGRIRGESRARTRGAAASPIPSCGGCCVRSRALTCLHAGDPEAGAGQRAGAVLAQPRGVGHRHGSA
jgi:hypothetical protein